MHVLVGSGRPRYGQWAVARCQCC